MYPETPNWKPYERLVVAIVIVVLLGLWFTQRAGGQALESFAETNRVQRTDKVPLVTAASGSNVNVWTTPSNLFYQVHTSILGSAGITVTVSAANGTLTISGSPDAALSNSLVSIINTASNANNSKSTTLSNALQTFITWNSNNIDSVSNNFRTADTALSNLINTSDTAISNRLNTLSNGLTTLTNNKLDATSGVHSGTLTLTNTARLRIAGGLGGTNVAEIFTEEVADPAPWADGVLMLNNRGGVAVEASTNGWLRAYAVDIRSTNSLKFSGAPTNSAATAGGNTLPANPLGFVLIQVNGVWVKVPYYLP